MNPQQPQPVPQPVNPQPTPAPQSFGLPTTPGQSPIPEDPYSRAIPGPLRPDLMPTGPAPAPIPAPAPQPAPAPIPQPTPAPQPMPAPQSTPQPTTVADTTNAPAETPNPTTSGPAAPAAPTPEPKIPKNVTPDVPTSTQSTLLISELRDGLVIMKDGSFRAVIACQSINFDLMSETEREGVEYSYQGFINSLNFTTQILVRSQRVDIGPYLQRLTDIRRNNENMLLGVLMDDYINFIDILSQEANIMDKSFFIVIPYYPSADAEKAIQQVKGLFGSGKSKIPEVTKIDRATYDKAITEINNRVETVTSGLFQMGIHSVRLNTKELAALYYNFNNPDTAVREPLVDFNKVATTYVKKGEKGEEENA